ncbi:hypothetical protein AVEN_129486-1 [Araneus ventricosus]|uniref:Uncharacterized protein n=1 Tax=Araneus ventricosus TaxID=182803 RepID=A0A4Y2S5L6_ARAVE|nr:hypothetical protein AVEN_129486-1 [Araneus ventricosus]
MDFFLWGYLKQQVYANPPPALQDLQRRITDACANVTPAMLHRVQSEVQARIQMCIVADGEKLKRLKDLERHLKSCYVSFYRGPLGVLHLKRVIDFWTSKIQVFNRQKEIVSRDVHRLKYFSESESPETLGSHLVSPL